MDLKVGFPAGMPLGGIGTGLIELMTNGKPGALLINNNWAQPLTDVYGCFFAVRIEQASGETIFRLLQSESRSKFQGVTHVHYSGLFPVAKAEYLAPEIPMRMEVKAFSPVVPHQVEKSNIPGVLFRFKFTNLYDEKIKLKLFVSWENLLGCGGALEGPVDSDRTGNFVVPFSDRRHQGLVFKTSSATKKAYPNALGEYALLTPIDAQTRFTSYVYNAVDEMDQVLNAFSSDQAFGADNLNGVEGAIHPAGAIGIGVELGAYQECEIPVVFAWYTPYHRVMEGRNEKAQNILKQYAPLYEENTGLTTTVKLKDYGHFYQNRFATAVAAGAYLLENGDPLLRDTTELHAFINSSGLPQWLKAKVINDSNPLTANTVLTRAGILATLEASRGMGGALGTMDQRLVAHAAYQLFYPDLNRTELQLFAGIQAEDGHITHFCGNFYESIGSSQVSYGDTTWPDLSCSFIIQCYRDLMNTGDYEFFQRMLPHIMRAYQWLKTADRDGDFIPEGGSSWDTEHQAGLFVYTGTVWLATLRVMEQIATLEKDEALKGDVKKRFEKAQENLIRCLWNGAYFNCGYDPGTGAVSTEIFPGQFAGEWVVRLLGLPGILPSAMIRTAIGNIYKLAGNKDLYRMIPIRTRKNGSRVGRNLDEQAWPQYTMVFLDLVAVYLGLLDEAIVDIKRFDEAVCDRTRAPWTTTLWHDCRTGMPCGGRLDRYMNCTASWFILNALTGFHHDAIAREMILGPAAGMNQPGEFPLKLSPFKLPLVSAGYWAMLTVAADGNQVTLDIHFEKLFDARVELAGVKLRGDCRSVSCRVNGREIGIRRQAGTEYTGIQFDNPGKVSLLQGDQITVRYSLAG